MIGRTSVLTAALLLACHGSKSSSTTHSIVATHSSSMALSLDGKTLYVVNADMDSVSIIDTSSQTLVQEILLNGSHPTADSNGNYFPAISPRAVVLSPAAQRLYVSGHASGSLYVIDLTTNAVTSTISVGSEPAGVLVSSDASTVYVACANDSKVVAVDTATLQVKATAQLSTFPDSVGAGSTKPWALAWSADGTTLYVTNLLGVGGLPAGTPSGITTIDAASMAVTNVWTIPDAPPQSSSDFVAYGQVRGLYDIAVQPSTGELWVTHIMLANQTSEVQSTDPLVFNNTAFPTLSLVKSDGTFDTRLSTAVQNMPGSGAFGDIVSGPHAFQFTPDGQYLLLVDSGSEDVLAVDVANRVEATLLRPLPGHQPEGIVISPDGTTAYVEERNSNDVAVITIDESGGTINLTAASTTIPRTSETDPMAAFRLGQHMFHSANSDEYPITQDHWISCSICHIEGRSDAVTWQFTEGPRDTPSNGGGMIGTGFLMHGAERRQVQDYFHTINNEQGGQFLSTICDNFQQCPGCGCTTLQTQQLNALEGYVDHAIPVPAPPTTDASLLDAGQMTFQTQCAECHSGPLRTDSGAGNPSLDLNGPEVETITDGGVLVHDVGTCNYDGGYPDVAHADENGNARSACLFDTPALRGLVDSAPYFHDGSSPTLQDALQRTSGKMGNFNALSASQQAALIEYLRSL